MLLFCKAKRQWGLLVGVTHSGQGSSPSLSNLRAPEITRECLPGQLCGKWNTTALSARGCAWISNVSVGRELCLCLCPSTAPCSPPGTALPSLPALATVWARCCTAQHSTTCSDSSWNLQDCLLCQPGSDRARESVLGRSCPTKGSTWGSSAGTCLHCRSLTWAGTDPARAAQGSWGRQQKCLEEIEHRVWHLHSTDTQLHGPSPQTPGIKGVMGSWGEPMVEWGPGNPCCCSMGPWLWRGCLLLRTTLEA